MNIHIDYEIQEPGARFRLARNTNIEWTDHTFNPWWGCTRVSPACEHCYAEAWSKRFGFDVWGHRNSRRFQSDSYWREPLKWDAHAAACGTRPRVFCASMADIFEWGHDLRKWRHKLWDLIEQTPNLDWLLLTKRPHLIQRLAPWTDQWPSNVWLGTTAETQRWANKRVPYLQDVPVGIKFLCCEPLLGEIDIHGSLADGTLNWIIVGGESGPKARAVDPLWVRQIRDSCSEFDTPFLFKQWGEWAPIDQVTAVAPKSLLEDRSISATMGRFGKRLAGRQLDGRTWDGLPVTHVSLRTG